MSMQVNCTKCNTELRSDAKFCDGCGSRVKIIFPDKTCPHCKREWTPRTANPKTCPKCGYDLTKESMLTIMAQDMGSVGMNEARCVGLPNGMKCGVNTHLYMRVKFALETRYEPVCYSCLMKYMAYMSIHDEWDAVEAASIERISG